MLPAVTYNLRALDLDSLAAHSVALFSPFFLHFPSLSLLVVFSSFPLFPLSLSLFLSLCFSLSVSELTGSSDWIQIPHSGEYSAVDGVFLYINCFLPLLLFSLPSLPPGPSIVKMIPV